MLYMYLFGKGKCARRDAEVEVKHICVLEIVARFEGSLYF